VTTQSQKFLVIPRRRNFAHSTTRATFRGQVHDDQPCARPGMITPKSPS
jgi:hypothetical protein